MTRGRWIVLALLLVVVASVAAAAIWPRGPQWTAEESAAIANLWIGNLPPLPPDPSNRYADDPVAAALGHKLFFDTRFSANGEVACATCHLPEKDFQDGLPLGEGVGVANRRTMPLAGTAYSPWLFWDGRADSQWAQALGPLENPVEHGSNRTYYVPLIAELYRAEYETIFGPMPDVSHLPRLPGPVDDPAVQAAWEAMTLADQEAVNRVFANMGKAIAAYERHLLPGPSRFDAYAQALIDGDARAMRTALTPDEVAGLRLFIGEANCIQCHNGPLFTNNDFHNTGVPAVPDLPEDTGRAAGAQAVLADPFNCLGRYSDAEKSQCAELRFMLAEGEQLLRQYKPPSLRNVAGRDPYMHAGQFLTLGEVLIHYNVAPAAPAGESELEPLGLNEEEMMQIIAFLKTLSGQVAADAQWLQAPP
jgi:cytochrome c peroxidase